MARIQTEQEATEKLLSRLPKSYRERVVSLEPCDDLIDDCHYILAWTEKFTDGEVCGGTYPVRSIAEAVDFVKESLFEAE